MNDNNSGIVMPSASTAVDLHDIIKDRKAERKLKAEEKRQKDLQSIKNLKSTTGIEPLQRFPKEIWEMVFNELSPVDRGNVYQVHPMFRDLLEPNKIRDILFPQIIKLLDFQYEFDYEYDFENYSKLRQVSKSMRDSVDQWAEDNLKKRLRVHGIVFSNGRFSSAYLHYESGYEREDVKNVLACLKEWKRKRRFFPRAVTIHFPSSFFVDDYEQEIVDEQRVQEILNEYKNVITALLEIIGDQILHLCFQFPGKRDNDNDREPIVSLDEVYILLQRWTSLMPNLEWLELEGNYPKKGLSVSWSVLKEYPFPHLASLERINFVCERFSDFILGTNRHVKNLFFETFENSHLHLMPNHLIRSLPDVTSFSVVNNINTRSSNVTFPMIRPLINLNWKLEGIILEIFDSTVSVNDLLRFLKNFPTLENVSLEFKSGVRIGYNGNFDYLALSNLTDLKLDVSRADINYGNGSNVHFFFSLQFLLYCSKLKTLNWRMCSVDDWKLRNHLKRHEYQNQSRGKTLDFRAGLRTLYGSNIWDVFPYLGKVDVQVWKPGKGCSCFHQYLREDVIDGMSVEDFLKVHRCSSFKRSDELQNCVMLYA